MTNLPEEIQFLIDFNVQDVAVALGLDIPSAAGAAILGASEADFLSHIQEAAQQVAEVARNLLTMHEAIAAMVQNLKGYQRILAVGDSITTYRHSYARLLHHLLPDVEFINHGYSGYTSNHGLELTHTRFVQLQPQIVFIKYGVNDCKRFGGADGRTLVSPDEYRGNLRGIIKAFKQYTDAEIVLLSPTPVVSAIVDTEANFEATYMTWKNHDIKLCGEIMQELSIEHQARFVDLFKAFGEVPYEALYLPDGLHPGSPGHQEILKTIATEFYERR